MFSDPIESLAEIDPTRSIYALIFGGTSSGYAIVRADFEDFKLVVLSNNLQNSGIRVKKILSLDNENYILIYGERFVQDSRDVQQSVLIRQHLHDPSDRELIHFDLAIHQMVRHPLFDAEKLPLCILQSYTFIYSLDVVNMSMHKICQLGSPSEPPITTISPQSQAVTNPLLAIEKGLIRINLPSIHLNSLVFSKDKPYFYVINETHVEKYSYHLNL